MSQRKEDLPTQFPAGSMSATAKSAGPRPLPEQWEELRTQAQGDDAKAIVGALAIGFEAIVAELRASRTKPRPKFLTDAIER